jgi:hypothetical protein
MKFSRLRWRNAFQRRKRRSAKSSDSPKEGSPGSFIYSRTVPKPISLDRQEIQCLPVSFGAPGERTKNPKLFDGRPHSRNVEIHTTRLVSGVYKQWDLKEIPFRKKKSARKILASGFPKDYRTVSANRVLRGLQDSAYRPVEKIYVLSSPTRYLHHDSGWHAMRLPCPTLPTLCCYETYESYRSSAGVEFEGGHAAARTAASL